MVFSWLSVRWGQIVFSVCVAIGIGVFLSRFSLDLQETYKNINVTMIRMAVLENDVANLEKEMADLKSVMSTASIRNKNIQKIVGLFDKNAVSLTRQEKYSIASEIYLACQKYDNLSVELICAMITQESGPRWTPNLISPNGAMGLMQVMPITGMIMARYEDIAWTSPRDVLLDPENNIRIGTRYLSRMIARYGVEGGLAAYNGGELRARMWLAEGKREGILADETEDYIADVLRRYQRYKG